MASYGFGRDLRFCDSGIIAFQTWDILMSIVSQVGMDMSLLQLVLLCGNFPVSVVHHMDPTKSHSYLPKAGYRTYI